ARLGRRYPGGGGRRAPRRSRTTRDRGGSSAASARRGGSRRAVPPRPEPRAEGKDPRRSRRPPAAVGTRRRQVVDREAERRKEPRQPQEVRDEDAGGPAVEPRGRRPPEVHGHVAALELLLEKRQQDGDGAVDAAPLAREAVVARPDLRP